MRRSSSGLLPRALLASPDRSLPLLPAGRVRIEPGTELRVSAGGRTKTVRQYAICGFGFQPYRLWLDESLEFFAAGGDWLAMVREGWEGALPELFRADQEAETAWGAQMGSTLAHRPAGPVVFRNANLFDAETGRSRPGTTVVVSGNRIQAVGPDGSVQVPPGAQVIDAGGKALHPGALRHARAHGAGGRPLPPGLGRHQRARPGERHHGLSAGGGGVERGDQGGPAGGGDGGLHRRLRALRRPHGAARRHAGAGAGARGLVRGPRLQAHQGLQLAQAGAGAGDRGARRTAAGCG